MYFLILQNIQKPWIVDQLFLTVICWYINLIITCIFTYVLFFRRCTMFLALLLIAFLLCTLRLFIKLLLTIPLLIIAGIFMLLFFIIPLLFSLCIVTAVCCIAPLILLSLLI